MCSFKVQTHPNQFSYTIPLNAFGVSPLGFLGPMQTSYGEIKIVKIFGYAFARGGLFASAANISNRAFSSPKPFTEVLGYLNRVY